MGIAMASASRGRLLELAKLQCSIFSTTFNPNQQRLGNKILRARLRGPALAAYYPRRSTTVEDMLNRFKKFGLEGYNEEENGCRESGQQRQKVADCSGRFSRYVYQGTQVKKEYSNHDQTVLFGIHK